VLKATLAAAVVLISMPVSLLLFVSTSPAAGTGAIAAGGPSVLALTGIPPDYLALYLGAAQTCPGLPWAVLAGIGTVESDNGQSDLPGVHSGANYAGAEGPMQFEPPTFAEYAVNAGHTGTPSPYNPADAIYTAAAMLCANGAASGTPAGIERAIFAYNHSASYVTDVLSWAARYALPAPATAAATAITFALRQLGKPYQWGADGPGSYDCSGLVYAAYAAAGIVIARTTFGWRQDGPEEVPADAPQGEVGTAPTDRSLSSPRRRTGLHPMPIRDLSAARYSETPAAPEPQVRCRVLLRIEYAAALDVAAREAI
jgi:cell wall-associated NlpC family hydrolase